eukprot:CAMPEP_0180671428 /NCGR_PEP_ID=MMETSP1037_2-20121125/64572_1 /TAXON_ID=632150 /ORGANISM="Azadinium spinosum, Strain 3D9" /LENGTH=870 /DNA_ID=CAMNT_0022700461 /DNA_START=36 /DNA_END=2649 /DNA_ORIENTATION=-
MGCLCAKPKPGGGIDGFGAKEWLNITSAPVSLQVLPRRSGGKGLTVMTTGMDKYGLIGILERAFRDRGFVIDSGEWSSQGSLFHGTFHLRPLSVNPSCESEEEEEVAGSQVRSAMESASVTKLCVRPRMPEISPLKVYQSQSSDDMEHLQVDVEHDLGEDLQVGLLAVVCESGGRTISGVLRPIGSRKGSARQMRSDSFGVVCPISGGLTKGALSSPEAFRLRSYRASLEKEGNVAGNIGALNITSEADSSDLLLQALRTADRSALLRLMKELPSALADHVSKTPYPISPSSWGLQLDGFKKYMGAGIVREVENDSGETVPVVQFTTLFVKAGDAEAAGSGRRLAASLSALGARKDSQFVNSIDLSKRRFTIEKVFLNNVCPAGQHLGAQSTAEQLYAPVWENGASGLGDLLPVNKIREIKLNDVVNWNTYAVMCVALTEHGLHHTDFGEHFQSSLDHELKTAGTTPKDCKGLPLVDVFRRTCLGKMICHILSLLEGVGGVCLELTEAKVTFREGHEFIAGEARNAMDIICKVRLSGQMPPPCVQEAVADRVSDPTSPSGQPAQVHASEAAFSSWAVDFTSECKVDPKRALWDIQQFASCKDRDVLPGQDVVSTPAELVLVSRVVHWLQLERAWSCLALSGGLAFDVMKAQRRCSDRAFVEALRQSTLDSLRTVSSGLILLRALVDQSLEKELGWVERYELICEGPNNFNAFINTLLVSLIRAAHYSVEIPEAAVESLRLFCFFKEQLGQERAFVLCRGEGKAVDNKDGMGTLGRMISARNLIGDFVRSRDRISASFQKLEEAESILMRDLEHDPQKWLDAISPCIDLCQELVEEALGNKDKPGEEYGLTLSFAQLAGRIPEVLEHDVSL